MSTPKHVPFASIYRPGFEVVEERQGNASLYPHTEQLPQFRPCDRPHFF